MNFQQLFLESKGKPILYNGKELKMIDRIPLRSGRIPLTIEFISTNSNWKQGIVLQTKGEFEVNGKRVSTKIILWEHTAPRQVKILIHSKDKTLIVYNVWEIEDGTVHYWHNGGALFTHQVDDNIFYYCNDGYEDEDFDDLVFKIEYN